MKTFRYHWHLKLFYSNLFSILNEIGVKSTSLFSSFSSFSINKRPYWTRKSFTHFPYQLYAKYLCNVLPAIRTLVAPLHPVNRIIRIYMRSIHLVTFISAVCKRAMFHQISCLYMLKLQSYCKFFLSFFLRRFFSSFISLRILVKTSTVYFPRAFLHITMGFKFLALHSMCI